MYLWAHVPSAISPELAVCPISSFSGYGFSIILSFSFSTVDAQAILDSDASFLEAGSYAEDNHEIFFSGYDSSIANS